MTNFADTLVTRARQLGHPLCVGLDPYLDRIPPLFRIGEMRPREEKTVRAVRAFLTAVLDLIAERVAIVKPQAAWFEQLGWRGMELLAEIVAAAQERNLLVLLDAKRGDIADTTAGYARAYLSADGAMPVDAITVNPYMGPDTIEPFVQAAEAGGRGVVVLVRNSNSGAAAFQKQENKDGTQFFELVAESLQGFESRLRGPETGWSSLMVTTAATRPADTDKIRARLPHALFLTLGYGTQGGSAQDAVRGFVPGPAGLEGGIVNCSRSVLYPPNGYVSDAVKWEVSLKAGLEKTCDELRRAASIRTNA